MRKLAMKNVVIDQKGCKLELERQTLMIVHDSFKKTLRLPLSQLESIIITTPVNLSSNLLTKLAEHKISLTILPSNLYKGQSCYIHGGWHAAVNRRQMQYEIIRHRDIAYYWAEKLVAIKIHRQQHTLMAMYQTIQQDKKLLQIIDKSSFLKTIARLAYTKQQLMQKIDETHENHDHHDYYQADDSEFEKYFSRLIGIEGYAAAQFFAQYRLFFAQNLQFNERNYRPPKDPVNVILSLSYTLLQGIYEQAVFAVGFDPYLGLLHKINYGRQSLACDFAELNRAFIERWVWQLFHDGLLSIDDFSINSNNDRPCEFLKVGRNRFYQAWASIKTDLEKQAYKQVWLWFKRIEQNFESDENLSFLEHISEYQI